MRVAIYNPYLDTLGGGERYTLGFAYVLAKNGYDVDINWIDKSILSTLYDRFGLKSIPNINIVSDVKRGEDYDLCFWVSDGSIPTLRAKRNFLHFQVPFKNVNGKSLLNKMKLFRVEKVIVNSNFTKKVIDKEYGIDSLVIYPPVDTFCIKRKRKEDIILYVGRFSDLIQNKRQDLLINSFKKLIKDEKFRSWKLILAGGVEVGADQYVSILEKQSLEYPIEIIKSPSFSQLQNLYGTAKIFWSAAGKGENESVNPQKFEHFGITLVEAMAGGCIPVVFAGGGYLEIINSGVDGYLWQEKDDLIKITKSLLLEKKKMIEISNNAIEKSKNFSQEVFENKVTNLLL